MTKEEEELLDTWVAIGVRALERAEADINREIRDAEWLPEATDPERISRLIARRDWLWGEIKPYIRLV